jgi:hypothetical protein
MKVRGVARRKSGFVAAAAAGVLAASLAGQARSEEPWVTPYGALKGMIAAGTNVESFGQSNAQTITAAQNPMFGASNPANKTDTNRFYTFDVGQSRFGLITNKIPNVTAKVEIDFLGFPTAGQATPTVAQFPRLRIAKIDYHFNKEHTLTIGQDWDLFGPLNTHTWNLTGNLFQAGNAAFMRQQLEYRYDGPRFEAGFAIGFIGNNNGPSFGDFEKTSVPTFAIKFGAKFGKSVVGITGIGSVMRFNNPGSTAAMQLAPRDAVFLAGLLYANLWPTKDLNILFEGWMGQNTYNTGLLTLGQGTFANDVQDAGGFISIKQNIGNQGIYAIAGMAHVLDQTANPIPLAYVPAATPYTPGTTGVNRGGAGPGMIRNVHIRLGYEFRPAKGLAWVIEPFYVNSWHKIASQDINVLCPGNTCTAPGGSEGFGVETGLIYWF